MPNTDTTVNDSSDHLALNSEHRQKYNQAIRREKTKALVLVLPLLFFLIVFFITPIGYMLYRSFYNPTVANLAPKTSEVLTKWQDISKPPNEETYKTLAYEIKQLQKTRLSGKFAEEVNRRLPRTGSVIKRTARKIKNIALDDVKNYQELLISLHEKWGQPEIWTGIRAASDKFTINYYANALDYKLEPSGKIVKQPEDRQVYLPILMRTFYIALIITLLTFLLGYPVAYYLSLIPLKKASILLIFVLLPFWTSLLVRTTAWIAILQSNGVINQSLLSLHVIDKPLDIIYNQFSTILAMTHILLPFMILPLYSVMKGIDPSYVRASQSLGANPFKAFIQVYFPLSLPGLSAGALLVFIISIGYYITPALIGGVDGQLISNLVAHHMRSTNNWELAAALGSVLLVLIIIFYWIYDRLVGASNIKL
ncbi:MAG: ABC transporter permease [Cocleimonas sp.]|nr:ABC transporter permease [Cocleimonas sp.]